MNLKDTLTNLLISGGKSIEVTLNGASVIVDTWFKQNAESILLYDKKDSSVKVEISLKDINDIKKSGYKEYIVSYLDGNKLKLKFRSKK